MGTLFDVSTTGVMEIDTISEKTAAASVTMSDGIKLPTSGGFPAELNYYEEFLTVLTFDSAAAVWTSSINTTASLYRVGKIVTFTFTPSVIGTTNGAPATNIELQFVSPLPARLRPAITTHKFVRILENNVGLANPGIIIFSVSGNITIIKDGASSGWGANLPNTGFFSGSFTWITS